MPKYAIRLTRTITETKVSDEFMMEADDPYIAIKEAIKFGKDAESIWNSGDETDEEVKLESIKYIPDKLTPAKE